MIQRRLLEVVQDAKASKVTFIENAATDLDYAIRWCSRALMQEGTYRILHQAVVSAEAGDLETMAAVLLQTEKTLEKEQGRWTGCNSTCKFTVAADQITAEARCSVLSSFKYWGLKELRKS
jgi:hypothetical protein